MGFKRAPSSWAAIKLRGTFETGRMTGGARRPSDSLKPKREVLRNQNGEPPTKPQRLRRDSPAGRTIMSTSHRLRRHGSIRSSAGSLNSPESGSGAVFIPPSANSKPISVLSSSGITKIPGPSNGPNLLTKSWLQLNASATKRSKHYAANFRFT
jgi:hypothetical protein